MSAAAFILTAAGAAAFDSSEAGQPVALAFMAFGDGAGAPYVPTGAETALRNELARVAVDIVARDPAHPTQLTITATLPAATGGFTVREVGVFTDAGDLALIGPANLYKPAPADGAPADLTFDVAVAISPTAQVVVYLDGDVLGSREWVLLRRQFFALNSATTAAPPALPAVEDQYLVPSGATGAWAGRDGQVAIWRNPTDGWLFVAPRTGAQANAADSRLSYRLTAAGWTPIKSSPGGKLYAFSRLL